MGLLNSGQSLIQPLELVGERGMLDAHEMEDGRIQVVEVNR
jgi:hypothetical protein